MLFDFHQTGEKLKRLNIKTIKNSIGRSCFLCTPEIKSIFHVELKLICGVSYPWQCGNIELATLK